MHEFFSFNFPLRPSLPPPNKCSNGPSLNGRGSIIYNVIVVASNDNESSQVTVPGFSICVPVPVIRGLTRFLTLAEVAEVEDGVVIIDYVAFFYEEGEGGEHYHKKNKFKCRVSRTEKRLGG